MPKAHITTKAGTKIIIEGNTEEVTLIVRQLEGVEAPSQSHRRAVKTNKKSKPDAPQKATPTNLILSLIQNGFFSKPKDLIEVKKTLEEMGHYYPVTTLSPSLLRLVRKRQVRRIKQEKKWKYTG